MRTFTNIALLLSTLLLLIGQPVLAQNEKESKEKGVSKYDRANAEYLLIEAQKFFLLEDYERTLAFLEQSLDVDANNHAAYFKRAETYLVTEKYDQGLKAIQKAQDLSPGNKYYYVLGAQLYKAKKDLNGAAEQYELMLSKTTDYKEFLLDLVDVYVALEDYDKALITLEITEKEYKSPDKFMLQKKDLLVQAGRSVEAIDYLKTLLQRDSNNAELLTEYSALMTLNNKDSEVITYLESIETTSPNASPLLLRLYLRNQQFDKAEPRLTELLNANQMGLEKEIELANDLVALKGAESTGLLQKLADHLVAKAPENTQVLEVQRQLLDLLSVTGEGNNATALNAETYEILLKLKESDPSNFQNWKKLLDFQYQASNWEGLAENALNSLDYFPNQGLFYFYSGSASLYTADYDEATDLLQQSLRLSFNNDSLKARAMGKLAELAYAQDQPEQGENHFNEALSVLRLPEIINNYSFELALRQLNMEQALELANEASALQPDQLKYIKTQAFVRFQMGEYVLARELMEAGMSRLPQQVDGPLLEQYGDVLMKLNLVDEALAQWQKAKNLGNTSGKLDQKIANKEYF